MTIVDTKTKDTAFSYTCNKDQSEYGRELVLSHVRRECLAKHWKDNLH